ncbi:MAG TPA: response regulator transcription factor [Gemmatimonadaceae bacterium]|nr:response regulator transcription factor [Gemmatimonadaceae bacterium]
MREESDAAKTVLVVDDNQVLLGVLGVALGAAGYVVETATDGTAGFHKALDLEPSIVLLDVVLPGMSGIEVASELRRRAFRAPILMMTGRGAVPDRVSGLDAGADDYLVKPFDNEELLARIKALIRRSRMRAEDTLLRVANLTLDPLTRDVARDGQRIALTQTQYAVLEYLMRNAGRQVTRDMIVDHVWRKRSADPDTTIVDVYVNYLREKIDARRRPKLLHTVRGVGYVLEERRSRRRRGAGKQ